jgi:hypothetical protein
VSIWVRSQNKGLGEYVRFLPPVLGREEIPDPEVPFYFEYGKVLSATIMGFDTNGVVDELGIYASEAEALAVLDSIQEHIERGFPYAHKGFGVRYVFQMPEAGFLGEGD